MFILVIAQHHGHQLKAAPYLRLPLLNNAYRRLYHKPTCPGYAASSGKYFRCGTLRIGGWFVKADARIDDRIGW